MDKNEIAVSLFNKYAEGYQEKFMDVSLYRDSLDYFCEQIPDREAKILEIACGPGNVTRYLLTNRPDFQLHATDLAPNMLELAKKNNPTCTFELLDGRHLDILDRTWNGIVCGFFLPYLSKDETLEFIKKACEYLQPGGVLYLSTMEDDYTKSGLRTGSQGDGMYMHYHESSYLIHAMEANGLELFFTDRIATQMSDGTEVIDLVLIGKKQACAENGK